MGFLFVTEAFSADVSTGEIVQSVRCKDVLSRSSSLKVREKLPPDTRLTQLTG